MAKLVNNILTVQLHNTLAKDVLGQ